MRVLFVGAFALFVANKLAVRPAVEGQLLPDALAVFTYSLPNFCEAVMGLTVMAGLLSWFRERGLGPLQQIGQRATVGLATLLTGVYVLTQEFGLHDLGGNNVFDPNDVAASLVGLVLTGGLFLRYGVLEGDGRLVTRTGNADA